MQDESLAGKGQEAGRSKIPLRAVLVVAIALIGAAAAYFFLAGGFAAQGQFAFRVVDSAGSPFGNIQVEIVADGKAQSITTDSFGEFSVSAADSNISISIDIEDFLPFDAVLAASAKEVNIITLQPVPPSTKTIEIYKADAPTTPITETVTASFSCAGGAAAPSNATTTDGKINVPVPRNCGAMSATLSAAGYDDKTASLSGTLTIVHLQPLPPPTANLSVIATTGFYNTPVPGIEIRLFSSGVLRYPMCMTDASGTCAFRPVAGTYYATAHDPSGAYADATTQSREVNAGESHTITISLEAADDPNQKKLFFRLADAGTGMPVSNASATIFNGNSIHSMESSDSNGIVEIKGIDANGTYSVVAAHPSYLLKAAPLQLLDMNVKIPQAISLQPATPANSGSIEVTVKRLGGNEISGAEVYLYSAQAAHHILSGTTGSDGKASFHNLPDGNYYAYAIDNGSDGNSETGMLAAGGTLSLEVALVIGEGKIEATVYDSSTLPVEDATVNFYDGATGRLLETSQTGSNGKSDRAEFRWDKKIYVTALKAGYLPSTSTMQDLYPNTTTKVKLVLEGETAYTEPKMELVDVLKDDMKKATKLEKNKVYWFRFRVILPDGDYTNMQAVVRAGLESAANANNSIIVLKQPYARIPKGSISASETFSASDPYSMPIATSSDAKQILLNLGSLSKGVYEFYAKAFIKSTAQENAVIEMRYGMKGKRVGTTDVAKPGATTLYLKSYVLGEEIECDPADEDCPNFIFYFTLSDPTGTHLQNVVSLEPGIEQELMPDINYSLEYIIWNLEKSNRSFAGIDMEFESDNGAVVASPSTVSVSSFENGTSIGGSVLLTGVQQSMHTRMNVSLGIGIDDENATLDFNVSAKKNLAIEILPSTLAAQVENQLLTIVVKDAASGALLQNAGIVVDAEQDFAVPAIAEGTTNAAGMFFAYLPRMGAGDIVYISVQKAGYAAQAITVPVENTPAIHPIPSLACIGIDKASLTIIDGTSGTFQIANNCTETVMFELQERAAETGITLEVQGANLQGNSEIPLRFSIASNSSKTIKAYADEYLGEYGIYIGAKPTSEQLYRDINKVTVYIISPGVQFGYCFDLDKTSFDLFHQDASGTFTNNCANYVPDIWMPNAALSSQDAMLASPYLNVPSLPLVFDYNVEVILTARIGLLDDLIAAIPADSEIEIWSRTEPDVAYSFRKHGLRGGLPTQTKLHDKEEFRILYSGQQSINPVQDQVKEIPLDAYVYDIITRVESGAADSNLNWVQEVDIENSRKGEIFTWYDPLERNIKVEYVAGDVDNNGKFEFTIRNISLKGEEYAIIEFEDRVSSAYAEGLQPLQDISFSYTIKASTGDEIADGVHIPADDAEHIIGDTNFQGDVKRVMFDTPQTVCIGGNDPHTDRATTYSYPINAFLEGSAWLWADDETIWTWGIYATVNDTNSICLNEWSVVVIGLIGSIASDCEGACCSAGNYTEIQTLLPEFDRNTFVRRITYTAQDDHKHSTHLYFCYPKIGLYDAFLKDMNQMQVKVIGNENAYVYFENGSTVADGTLAALPPVPGILPPEDQSTVQIKAKIAPPKKQKFQVRLHAGEQGACYSESNEIGYTGRDAMPLVMLNWRWNAINIDETTGKGICDDGYAENGEDSWVYCDAAQLAKEVAKKLIKIQELAEQDDFSEINKYLRFNSYLTLDSYSSDFMNDFDDYVMTKEFFDAPSGYTNAQNSLNLYFSDPSRLKFVTDTEDFNITPMPYPGLYSVEFNFIFPSGEEWVFYRDGMPNAVIEVHINPLRQDTTGNPFYNLPFDGELGIEDDGLLHREGYGLGFSGDRIPIVLESALDQTFLIETTEAIGSPLGTLDIENTTSFDTLQKSERGVVLNVSRTQDELALEFRGGHATPVAMFVSQNGQQALSYYYLHSQDAAGSIDAGNYASRWTGVGSTLQQCTDFAGRALPYMAEDSKMAPGVSHYCRPVPAGSGNSYGFLWHNLQQPLPGSADKLIMYSTFYTPDDRYELHNACSLTGAFASPTMVVSGEGGMPLKYTARLDSLNRLFELAKQEYICFSRETQPYKAWWNREKLFDELKSYYQSLAQSAGIAECSPLGTLPP